MDNGEALETLITLLDEVPSSEFGLIVEASLIPMLSALAPYSTFTAHGVTAFIPLTKSSAGATYETNALVFLTRPNPESLQLISQCVLANSSILTHVIVAPEIELSVPLLFTKYGVLGDIELRSWPIGFVADPIEPELYQLFDTRTGADQNEAIWPLVWSLDWLQRVHTGAFGRITAIGPTSKYLATLLKKKRAESLVKEQTVKSTAVLDVHSDEFTKAGNNRNYFGHRFGYASSTFFGSNIEQVVIIDRDLDLVTPLLCQTTYGGVLSETMGISASGVTKTGLRTSLKDDTLFQSLSGAEFSDACEYLHVSAKQLQQEYRSRNDLPRQDSSIAEIREVVSKLGSLQKTQKLLDTHTDLASLAISQLENSTRRDAFSLQMQILDNQLTNTQAVAKIQDLIYQGAELHLVLRLLSLLCLVRGGLKENVLQTLFYGDLLKTYGYQVLKSYQYLQTRGLVYPSKSSSFLLSSSPFTSFARFGGEGSQEQSDIASTSIEKDPSSLLDTPASQIYSWYTVNKSYKLYPAEGAEARPYSGFVPLAARLVRLARGPLSKTLLEPEIHDEVFRPKNTSATREAKLRRTLVRNSPSPTNKPAVLVVIVGGVTYAEVTAIKRAFQEGNTDGKKILIASDRVISGRDIVDCTEIGSN